MLNLQPLTARAGDVRDIVGPTHKCAHAHSFVYLLLLTVHSPTTEEASTLCWDHDNCQ